jgi:hypothetical protein
MPIDRTASDGLFLEVERVTMRPRNGFEDPPALPHDLRADTVPRQQNDSCSHALFPQLVLKMEVVRTPW